MKRYKYSLLLFIPFAVMVSCKKSAFVAANVNPSTLTSVDPGAQFLYAARSLPNDFEYYYDVLRDINAWMQFTTGSTGNGSQFNLPGANFDYRYGNFYDNVGVPLADIPHLIANMSTSEAAARVYEAAIAKIYMAYEAFYVTDINGSIPYSQAFQGRYGGTLTPVYDTQETIYDSVNAQVKAAVAVLESSPATTQVNYGTYDPFYGGVVANWIKAGNALRLKVALRLMKRDPTTMKSIVTEVLADNSNQMSSVSDSWVLLVGPTFADATGNYNPSGFLAAKPVVDFMNTTGDPRLQMFYRPNSNGVYVGSPTNPDTCALASYQALYTAADTPFSQLQHRLFTPNFDENDGNGSGTGVGFFPVLTYAEYCFIRADLGARGYTTDDPGTWYNAGVTASIVFYGTRAVAAGVTGYSATTASLTDSAVAYLQKPGVLFVSSTATEQIACQAYLDFFRQPSEAWAWWKRTGYPNTSSVLPWSALTSSGTTLVIPRRAPLTLFSTADANYANQKTAYDAMMSDANFGTSLSDVTGRVWWDEQ